jgi:hypothetical protein
MKIIFNFFFIQCTLVDAPSNSNSQQIQNEETHFEVSEIHNLYSSPYIIRVLRNTCKILAGNPEWKRPHGICRWEINVKMDHKDMEYLLDITKSV